jgi:hypothetical protein
MNHIPRIRHVAAALACACLGLAITAPAAFAQPPGSPGYQAMPISLIREALLHGEILTPASGPGGAASSVAPAVTRIVVASGMPGWQIVLIAAGAALLAAMVAVFLNQAWTARRNTITGSASREHEASASFQPTSNAPEHDVVHFP